MYWCSGVWRLRCRSYSRLDRGYLKIDGVFIRDILDDEVDAAMVEAIAKVAHVMGIQAVAEFVGNDEFELFFLVSAWILAKATAYTNPNISVF